MIHTLSSAQTTVKSAGPYVAQARAILDRMNRSCKRTDALMARCNALIADSIQLLGDIERHEDSVSASPKFHWLSLRHSQR